MKIANQTCLDPLVKMSARKKTKLCWHCHGTIPADVTHCAYCGERCERAGSAPYFPPYSEHQPPRDLSDRDPLPESRDRGWSFEQAKALCSNCLKSGAWPQRFWSSYLQPILPALLVSWGVALATLAVGLLLFSQRGTWHLTLEAGSWWKCGLVAAGLIWWGVLGASEREEHD